MAAGARAKQHLFGAGVVAEYDTTDNIFYPQSGLALKGNIGFPFAARGDYHYNTFSLDGKVFIPLSQTLTTAVAGNYQSLTHHDKHLMPMARPYIALRGISRYRYQGDDVVTAQTSLGLHPALDPAGIRWRGVRGAHASGTVRGGMGGRFSLPDCTAVRFAYRD